MDTNILIYAFVSSSPFHARAREVLRELAEGVAPWAIPWPCAYELLRVVTHPRVYRPPLSSEAAYAGLAALFELPNVRCLSETERHAEVLKEVLRESAVQGNLVHDAHIAALCLEHGVSELLTADTDFFKFKQLRSSNPLRGMLPGD